MGIIAEEVRSHEGLFCYSMCDRRSKCISVFEEDFGGRKNGRKKRITEDLFWQEVWMGSNAQVEQLVLGRNEDSFVHWFILPVGMELLLCIYISQGTCVLLPLEQNHCVWFSVVVIKTVLISSLKRLSDFDTP
jgi:hypothetical protein